MAPPAARRAAAGAVRYFVATARSDASAAPRPTAPRAAARRTAAPRATSGSAAASRAAAPRAAAPSAGAFAPSAGSVAASSRAAAPSGAAFAPSAGAVAAAPSAGAAAAASRAAAPSAGAAGAASRAVSPAGSTGNSTSAGHLGTTRFGLTSRSLTRATPFRFKIQRRFSHNQRIPEEVQSELKRIESEGLKRHSELQESIVEMSKKVSERSSLAKVNKAESTRQMGKTAWMVCSTVIAGAAISGYGIFKLVMFKGSKNSRDAASEILEKKIAEMEKGLERRIDSVLAEKEKEEFAFLTKKQMDLDKKALQLDKKETELEMREAAVAAKEVAAKEVAAKEVAAKEAAAKEQRKD